MTGDERTGVSITPYMMAAGDEKIVADRLHAVLSKPPAHAGADAGRAGGRPHRPWDVRIEYAARASTHALQLRQRGATSTARTRATSSSRDLAGTIDGDAVRLRSASANRHGDSLSFTLHRQGRRRRDGGHARHGRVPRARRGRRSGAMPARRRAMQLQRRIAASRRPLVLLPRSAAGSAAAAGAPAAGGAEPPSTTCCCRAATSSTPEQHQRGARRRDRGRQDRRRRREASIPAEALQDGRRRRASTSRPA